MALSNSERVRRHRMRKAGKALPPTPKELRGAEVRRLLAEQGIQRRAAYYRIAKLRNQT